MDARRINSLEQVIGLTKQYDVNKARRREPDYWVLSAEHVAQNTTLPVAYANVGGYVYHVRIFKDAEGRDATMLNVSLIERNCGAFYDDFRHPQKKVIVSFGLPLTEDADFVRNAARELRNKYRNTGSTAHHELPCEVPLIAMIATRIEYYLNGGKCSEPENRMN